jgi:uncharacterized membrane protein YedE/YeeE
MRLSLVFSAVPRNDRSLRSENMSLVQVALLGGLVGVPLGYAMQRTNLCFNSAYRETVLNRNTVLLRAIGLAILVQMLGLALIVQLGIGGVELNVVPFFWLAAMIGGFIFGVSMVYAEGCSSTVWYRVGNGNMGSLVTLVGFALGEALTSFGLLSGLRETLQGPELTLTSGSLVTLPNILGLEPWLVIIPTILLIGIALARTAGGSYLNGWDWRRAGLALGLIGALAWVVAWPTGWHYGIGIVGATGPFVQALFEGPGVLNWGSFMVLSLPIGAFFAARRSKELRLQIPDANSTLRMFAAGGMMGISATIAGGCNTGHTFTGVPTLALSSLTATLFIFLGAWFGNYLRFLRPAQIRLYGTGTK